MALSETETTCANCNLVTPKSRLRCVHCGKPWHLEPQRKKPTPDDIVAYNAWLQKMVLQ